MCFDPWEHSAEKMGQDYVAHLTEAERGRNVATNTWKADGFLDAIAEKYGDEYEFTVAKLEDEVERLRNLVEFNPRYLRVLEAAEQALKDRAERGAMAA